jgi:hypothetical protein
LRLEKPRSRGWLHQAAFDLWAVDQGGCAACSNAEAKPHWCAVGRTGSPVAMTKVKTIAWDPAQHLRTEEDMLLYFEAAPEESWRRCDLYRKGLLRRSSRTRHAAGRPRIRVTGKRRETTSAPLPRGNGDTLPNATNKNPRPALAARGFLFTL